LTAKLSLKEITKIRRLARTMRLKDVARVTGYNHCTVERYAKGIRTPYNSGTLRRPNHPCPSCGSTRVVSNGKRDWRCQNCPRHFRKNPSYLRVSLREHNQMIQLKQQGLTYSQVAQYLNRGRRTVQIHVLGKLVPSF